MAYQLFLTNAAAKDLTALPKKTQKSIDEIILSLADNPRPQGSKKLKGAEDLYRVRKGDYRIIYQIEDDKLIVTVVRVGNRREVYRRL